MGEGRIQKTRMAVEKAVREEHGPDSEAAGATNGDKHNFIY